VAAAGTMGVALAAAQHVLFAMPLHGVARFAALAVLVVVGTGIYGGACLAFGGADRGELRQLLGRRARGRVVVRPGARP